MLKVARCALSRRFWWLAFRCAGLEPPLMLTPDDVARQEARGFDRIARNLRLVATFRQGTNGPEVLRIVRDGNALSMPEYAFRHDCLTADECRALVEGHACSCWRVSE